MTFDVERLELTREEMIEAINSAPVGSSICVHVRIDLTPDCEQVQSAVRLTKADAVQMLADMPPWVSGRRIALKIYRAPGTLTTYWIG